MKRVAAPAVDDTTLQGAQRRRVWQNPEVHSHSLVVLTVLRLYLTPQTGPPPASVLANLEQTYDLDSALGPYATTIELSSVRRVTLDLLTNTLKLDYRTAAGHVAQVAISFATAEAADALFSKVWRRLGERFALTQKRPHWWKAARDPLAAMAGILLATVVVSLAANAATDGAVRTPLDAILHWTDWRAVCAVGGAALAVTQAWLYRRFTRPPSRLELLPK